jgi:preprotein translocase subunit SecA
MTGTAKTEEEAFRNIYNMNVIAIPTNRDIVRDDRADLIFASMEGKFKAVVEDIAERHAKGQPVLVGTVAIETSEYVSELLKKKGIPHSVLNAKQHEREGNIILDAGQPGAVTIATNMAGRGTDIKLGEGVKEVGGLAVIGTERHESRRIDNQLRGRSGRQGDPGESRFFLSLEDDLMRLFGSERIIGVVDRLGLKDDEPIDAKILSGSIESAQKRLEDNNFERRKNVLAYDDVMNQQRSLIYKQRGEVLDGGDMSEKLRSMMHETIEEAVSQYLYEEDSSLWDVDGLRSRYMGLLCSENDFRVLSGSPEESRESIRSTLLERAEKLYKFKEELFGAEQFRELERVVLLRNVDQKWMAHLEAMDSLMESIGLQAYAQRNPISEYRIQGADLFDEMIREIRDDTVRMLLSVVPNETALKRVQVIRETGNNSAPAAPRGPVMMRGPVMTNGSGQPVKNVPTKAMVNGTVVNKNKVGRNDPCPCGSGKKFKKCCGSSLNSTEDDEE